MNGMQLRNTYSQIEAQAAIHPVKLVHLMYERVLSHLDLAEEGVKKNDPRLRGENLGKAIALLTELNASVEEGDNSEAARFLRGLYTAILAELPKVSVNKDVRILQQAQRYIKRLSDIWEQTAMQENEAEAGKAVEQNKKKQEVLAETPEPSPKQKVAGLSVSV